MFDGADDDVPRGPAAARATPSTAMLSASVPPEVKIRSVGLALISAASCRRAASSRCLAAWPK